MTYIVPSTRLWFWRLRTRTALRSKIIERRATPLNCIDLSTCKVRTDWEIEQFAKGMRADHIAQTAPSAMLMHMANHEATQRLARCGA